MKAKTNLATDRGPFENGGVSQTCIPRNEQGKKGRILRLKHGYNPNSSSLGSEFFAVFVVPASLFAVTIGFGAVSGIILSAFMREPASHNDSDKEPVSSETDEHQEITESEGR